MSKQSMSSGNSIPAKVHKSLRVLSEMAQVRSKNEEEEKWQSVYQDLQDTINDEDEDEVGKSFSLELGWLLIKYDLEEKLDITSLNDTQKKKLGKQLASPDITHVIFVLTRNNTRNYVGRSNDLVRFVEHELKKTTEVFHLHELQYNVTKHHFVDPHFVIRNEEEKQDLLRKFNLKKIEKMPLILSTDPVVRFIGGKPGDIIKIDRYLENAGVQPFYRYCTLAQSAK